jgi:hypothetical protein
MKSLLTKLIFGSPAHGVYVSQPNFRSTVPKDRLSVNQWAQTVKFGSRYGHKGSFYQHNISTRSYF